MLTKFASAVFHCMANYKRTVIPIGDGISEYRVVVYLINIDANNIFQRSTVQENVSLG